MAVDIGNTTNERDLVLSLDPGNKGCWSNNFHPNPTNIFQWARSRIPGVSMANNARISIDPTIKSPVNGIPVKMTVTGLDPYMYTYSSPPWNISSAQQDETWTISVYAKASVPTSGQLFFFTANSAGSYIEAPALTINITENWQRFSYTRTLTNSSTAFIQSRLDGADAGTIADIWWDGFQVERGPNATEFNPIGNNNKVIYDLSTKKINGKIINGRNVLYLPDDGESLRFDYTKQNYFEFDSSPELLMLGNQPYSLDVWVKAKRNPGGSNWTGILDRESNLGSGRDGYNLYILGSSGTAMYVRTERFTSGTNSSVGGDFTQSQLVDVWNKFTTTYNGSNTLNLYWNGSLISSNTSATGQITNNVKKLTVGVRGGNYLDAQIGTLKIYKRELSSTEILDSYQQERARYGV